jgi:protocatechuate 3,4-dioxygenase beta subunit
MKRRLSAVVGVAIAVVLIALWWSRRDGASSSPASDHAAERGAGVSPAGMAPWSDPRTLPRGSISGTVRDDAKSPIARAQVCTNAVGSALPSAITSTLRCVFADEQGRYQIGDLIAADYLVHASARGFRPGAFHPTTGADHDFALAAGEARTGVDVELRRGGGEVSGVVLDASGGPIARAEIREATRGSTHAGAAVESDEQGRFSLWTDRGQVTLEASADGYVPARRSGRAPGTFEILMLPESSLAGSVVDAATEQPVAGARVDVEVGRYEDKPAARDITDAQGKFRLEHLAPGRYTVAARAERGYGRSAGSLLVGLGQHVDGAVIRLFPAHRVAGKVVIASSGKGCTDARVSLQGRVQGPTIALRRLPDGQRLADGVVSGTYTVSVRCAGYAARDSYDSIVVGDRDITGVVWEVDDGARIRGKVLTRSGAPIEDVVLRAQSIDPARRRTAWASARSKADGSFELRGLHEGLHRITLISELGAAPREGFEVTVAPLATVERDFVLDDGGTLVGDVVDDAGGAVPDVDVVVVDTKGSNATSVTSNADGAFAFEALSPGDYRVRVSSAMPRTPADPRPTTVTVRAGQITKVKLTVESRRGAITGTVVDAANQPVPDAFLSWARESDGPERRAEAARTREDWQPDARPVLTAPDGSFRLTGLIDGSYTLRAHRKGGGEAIAEHVATGTTAKLQIKPTGSIAGTVIRKGGPPPRDLRVTLQDTRTGLSRSESFFMTEGRFTVTDLPAGQLGMVVDGDGSQSALTVDLREGEARTGVDVELIPLVTVTGRLVEHGTQKPVPGYQIIASPVRGAGRSDAIFVDDETANISDEAGRFTLRGVATGANVLRGVPRDGMSRDRSMLNTVRTISGTGTVDIGDVALIRSRVKSGEPIGVLGLQLEPPMQQTVEQRELKISAIDPAGPAAGTGLQVGDVITTCDGVDVTGEGAVNWWRLTTAPPGTRLTLGTRRGITATIVLARGTSVMP